MVILHQQWEAAALKSSLNKSSIEKRAQDNGKGSVPPPSYLLRRSLSDSSRGGNSSLLSRSTHSVERPPLPPKSLNSHALITNSRLFKRANSENTSTRRPLKEGEETFLHSTQDKKANNHFSPSNSNCDSELVLRPSIADMTKSMWFEKKELASKNLDRNILKQTSNTPLESPRGTISSSMTSSASAPHIHV